VEEDTPSIVYTNAVDIWSFGCVIYKLAAKHVPFSSGREVKRFCDNRIPFPAQPLQAKLMTDVINFLESILVAKPLARPSAEIALQHPWLVSNDEYIDFSLQQTSKLPEGQGSSASIEAKQRGNDGSILTKAPRGCTLYTRNLPDAAIKRDLITFGWTRCLRGPLGQYAEAFSPPFLHKYLEQAAIKKLTSTLSFISGTEILVHMSTGQSRPPMSLIVCEFRPTNEHFLRVSDINPESHDQLQTFPFAATLPYAIRNPNAYQLKQVCLKHIKDISKEEYVSGDSKSIRFELLRAICRFQQADPIAKGDSLLRKAIMIAQISQVMGRKITFAEDSRSKIAGSLQNLSTISTSSSLSARVIGRQIKGAMKLLSTELTKEVLVGLEGELRQKKPKSWALCLCTHLILCIYVEELQISVDAFVLWKISNKHEDPKYVRDCGAEICRRLEEVTLLHSWILMSGVLRGILRNHNPFIHDCSINDESIQNQAEVDLVNSIRHLMTNHEEEIAKKAKNEYFGCSSRVTADHKEFRDINAGRLLSKVFKRLL
jgi:Protein kinase domain